jgi:hypothetical protein
MLSFSVEEFMLVLEQYNTSIWPMQIVAYLLVILVLFFSFKSYKYSQKSILVILSFLWLFNGVVFSLIFYAPSHFFGYVFGICCIVQGLIFLFGLKETDLLARVESSVYSITGIILVLYAAAGYQIFGYYLGHVYPKFFPVGLVPCPTTIFTFGIFLIIPKKIPVKYYVIPSIVALGGFLAAYNGIYEDIGLIISGLFGTYLIIRRNKQFTKQEKKAV